MADKVILHVGSPKTGTSFLQDQFFGEREQLRADGVLYPGERFDYHFLAAVDLMSLKWGGLEADAVGVWDELAAQVRAWPGTAIVSHEILAQASVEQVARALESLGGEVHVVVSARDLVRQIPAEWQENIKHRRTTSYTDYLAGIQDPKRPTILGQWFWGVQETPAVLERWGATLPPAQVHLVTVPPAGAAPDLLWHRFAQAFGFDPESFTVSAGRTNASLGVAEAAVLRSINGELNGVVANPDYRALVREELVHQNLSRYRTSARLSVPADVWAWADDLSRRWVAEIALRGYDVVGDLDDLIPAPALPYVDPDDATPAEREAVLLRSVTAMTVEAARLRAVVEERDREIAGLHGELEAMYSTRTYKFKQRLVAKADNSRLAARGLDLYRRLRG